MFSKKKNEQSLNSIMALYCVVWWTYSTVRLLNCMVHGTTGTTTKVIFQVLLDNPFASVKDKSQAPPITVFPNDTIVIHYETISFDPSSDGNHHSNSGPRSERDSNAATTIPGAGSIENR